MYFASDARSNILPSWLILIFLLASAPDAFAQHRISAKSEAMPPSAESLSGVEYDPFYAYVCDGAKVLTAVDNVGNLQVAGNMGVVMWDIAFVDNVMYGVSASLSDSKIYRILPSGSVTLVGSTGVAMNALACDPNGELYGAGGGNIYRIAHPEQSTAAEYIGSFGGGFESSGDLAFPVEEPGKVYATVQKGGTDHLVIYNLETGSLYDVGDTGVGGIYGLSLKDGILYGVTGGRRLIRINPGNSSVTDIADIGVEAFGMAHVPGRLTFRLTQTGGVQVGALGLQGKFGLEGTFRRAVVNGEAHFTDWQMETVFDEVGNELTQVLVFDLAGDQIGHIEFKYTRDDCWKHRTQLDTYLFVHGDRPRMEAANGQWWSYRNGGWEYYEAGEYQVSMLVPPREDFGSFQGPDRRPVVFVHGINAKYRSTWGVIPNKPALAPFDCWRFYYPHDQFMGENAILLDQAIGRVLSGELFRAPDYTATRVDLVAHSMGGLVSRSYIQSPSYLGKQNVSRLLMFGTPNHGSLSSYRSFYTGSNLARVLDIFEQNDREAPAHEFMSPGSSGLFALNGAAPRLLGSGDIKKDYLVVAGIEDLWKIQWGHREISGQDDGFVAVASASLLEQGVPLALVDEDHESIKLDHETPFLIATFLDQFGVYDPEAGTPDFRNWVLDFYADEDALICGQRFAGKSCAGLLQMQSPFQDGTGSGDAVAKYQAEVLPLFDNIIRLGDVVDGGDYMQRLGDSSRQFFLFSERDRALDEMGFRAETNDYRVVFLRNGQHIAAHETVSFRQMSTEMMSLTCSRDACIAANAPNYRTLYLAKDAAATYTYEVDDTVQMLLLSLGTDTLPADLSGHDFTIIEPGGRVIDPLLAAGDPMIEFSEDVEFGPAVYRITAPATGVWQMDHADVLPSPVVQAAVYASYAARIDVPGSPTVGADSIFCEVTVTGGSICAGQDVTVDTWFTAAGSGTAVPLGVVTLAATGPDTYAGGVPAAGMGSYRLTMRAQCDRESAATIVREDNASIWVGKDLDDVTGVDPGGFEDTLVPGATGVWIASVRPNPFNAATAIVFELATPGRARVEIFDVMGRRVAELADTHYSAGRHILGWRGRDDAGRNVASGVYFVTVSTSHGRATGKLVLLK